MFYKNSYFNLFTVASATRPNGVLGNYLILHIGVQENYKFVYFGTWTISSSSGFLQGKVNCICLVWGKRKQVRNQIFYTRTSLNSRWLKWLLKTTTASTNTFLTREQIKTALKFITKENSGGEKWTAFATFKLISESVFSGPIGFNMHV